MNIRDGKNVANPPLQRLNAAKMTNCLLIVMDKTVEILKVTSAITRMHPIRLNSVTYMTTIIDILFQCFSNLVLCSFQQVFGPLSSDNLRQPASCILSPIAYIGSHDA